MQLLILAIVFFGIVFLIVAFYGVVNREALEASEAAREQLRAGGTGAVAAMSILRDDRSSEIPILNKLLTGRALTTSIAIRLERAGSTQKAGQFLLTSLAFAVAGLVVGQRWAETRNLTLGERTPLRGTTIALTSAEPGKMAGAAAPATPLLFGFEGGR